MREDELPLPEQAHLPGRTPRPGAEALVCQIAREAETAANWRDGPAFSFGLRLYHARFFWEAHEVWEAVWTRSAPNSAERLAFEGLIQLANAGLKLRMGRPGAALRLLDLAEACLTEAVTRGGASPLGIGFDQVIPAIGACRAQIPAAPMPGWEERALAALPKLNCAL